MLYPIHPPHIYPITRLYIYLTHPTTSLPYKPRLNLHCSPHPHFTLPHLYPTHPSAPQPYVFPAASFSHHGNTLSARTEMRVKIFTKLVQTSSACAAMFPHGVVLGWTSHGQLFRSFTSSSFNPSTPGLSLHCPSIFVLVFLFFSFQELAILQFFSRSGLSLFSVGVHIHHRSHRKTTNQSASFTCQHLTVLFANTYYHLACKHIL